MKYKQEGTNASDIKYRSACRGKVKAEDMYEHISSFLAHPHIQDVSKKMVGGEILQGTDFSKTEEKINRKNKQKKL